MLQVRGSDIQYMVHLEISGMSRKLHKRMRMLFICLALVMVMVSRVSLNWLSLSESLVNFVMSLTVKEGSTLIQVY